MTLYSDMILYKTYFLFIGDFFYLLRFTCVFNSIYVFNACLRICLMSILFSFLHHFLEENLNHIINYSDNIIRKTKNSYDFRFYFNYTPFLFLLISVNFLTLLCEAFKFLFNFSKESRNQVPT